MFEPKPDLNDPHPHRARAAAAASPIGAAAVRGALMALVTLLGGAAQAQTLVPLVDAARGHDATLQSVRSQLAAAQARADQTQALKRPSVNATVGATATRGTGTYYSGSIVEAQNAPVARLAATQSLFNRADDKTIAQAERNVEVARAQNDAADQDLMVRVAQAYFDVLAAADALETVRASKRAIGEQLASAKRAFEVGTATITDTREAQARADLAQAQELAAENDLETKRLILEQLVGRSPVQPRPLAQPVTLPVLEGDARRWAETAEASSPLLQQLRLAYDVARLETEKAQAGHLPTLAVNGGVDNGHGRLANSAGSMSGTGWNASVGLTLSIPIYAGNAVNNRVREAQALEDKARSDLEAQRRVLRQNATNAALALQSLRSQVAALEAAEASSRLALEATQLGYQVGVRVNIDVLNATAQLQQTRRDLARARYDVIVNSLRVKQIAGVLGMPDLQRVEALLAP